MAPPQNEFRVGWKVLLSSMLGVMCGASPVPFNTIGFFMGPLNAEFGWSFGQIGFGVLIFGVTASLLAPVYGWMADKYGVRPVALWSLFGFGVAFGAFAFTPGNIWGFYGLWLLLGLVSIGSTPVTWSRAINLWFFKRRGLALGLTLVGTSIAAVILPKLTVTLIGEFGWRGAYIGVAMMPLVIALPIGIALFREPHPDERPGAIIAGGDMHLTGVTLDEALRDRRFWIIFISIALIAFAYGGSHIHLPQILKGHGFEPEQIALIAGSLGAAIFAGRIIAGYLLDRFWAPLVTLPILSLPALSCYLLAGNDLSVPMAYLAVALLGFAAGAEVDLIAYLAGRYFGMANYGKIYGVLYMPFGMAAAASPAAYGYVRDIYGSYDPILGLALVLFIFGAVILLGLGKYPNFDADKDSG